MTVGESAIGDAGEDAAFEEAKRDALREAVEQGVGVLVSSSTRVSNFEVVTDEILAESVGYVRRYDVLERGKSEEGMFRVVLEAVVDLGDLHRDLASLTLAIHEAGNPRILCVGTEIATQDGTQKEQKWGVLQAALTSMLEAAGGGAFDLVACPGDWDPADLVDMADAAMVADLAAKRGVDIVLWGVARVEAVDVPIPFAAARLPASGFQSAMARVEIQALWADTRELITAVSGTGRGAEAEFAAASGTAIRHAVDTVGEQLSRALAASVRLKAYGDRDLQVVVRAPAAGLRQFERDFADRMQAVVTLEPRSYSSGEAVYDVRAHVGAFEIARELSAEGLPGIDVEIIQASTNTLTLQLAEPGP